MDYKILPHTADLRLEIYGQTLEKLFKNAVSALAAILTLTSTSKGYGSHGFDRGGKDKEIIKIQSTNFNTLLVDFLNEILARSNINKRVYKIYKIIKLESNFIDTEVIGRKIEEFKKDVKAVTYHEATIKKENNTWKANLVLDI